MVIVVGLSCFIMYAAQGAVAGWAAILSVRKEVLISNMQDFLYSFCCDHDSDAIVW